MKTFGKVVCLSAGVAVVQISLMVGMYFCFGARDLGKVLGGTLFVGTFLFNGRQALKSYDSSGGPVFSIHPGTLWTPFLLGGIGALAFWTLEPNAPYSMEYLGIVAALYLSAFAIACEAFDFPKSDQLLGREWPANSRILLLSIMIGPQVAIALAAAVALAYRV